VKILEKHAAEAVLVVGSTGTLLRLSNGCDHKLHGGMGVLRLRTLCSGGADNMVDACGLRPGDVFVDATAGQLSDALIAAHVVGPEGRVLAIEASPLLHAVSSGRAPPPPQPPLHDPRRCRRGHIARARPCAPGGTPASHAPAPAARRQARCRRLTRRWTRCLAGSRWRGASTPAGFKCRPPCWMAAPGLAAWCLLGRRPLLRTPERRLILHLQPPRHTAVLAARPAASADVVYFDPMFRRPQKASGSFDVLRSLAHHAPLTAEAVAQARRVARRRVVVMDQSGGAELERLGLTVVKAGQRKRFGVLEVGGEPTATAAAPDAAPPSPAAAAAAATDEPDGVEGAAPVSVDASSGAAAGEGGGTE
jgi:hypothetical protein